MDMDDPALTGWLAAVRTLHFICCLLISNVWIFDRIIVTRYPASWRRTAVTLLWIATPLALLSGAAWFVLVAANMGDISFLTALHSPAELRLVWSHTRFGRTWQIHTLFWITGAIMSLITARFHRGNWIGLIAGLALTASLAWAGHGDTGPIPMWHLTADVLHLLAAAIWPAGLVPFSIVLYSSSRSTDSNQWEILHQITRRFSAASLIAVASLTATGLINSWCLLGSFGAFLTTNYGRLLGIKVILFAMMTGLGAVNLIALKPKLKTGEPIAKRLRFNVTIEIVLGTLIIAAVGLLGLLEPARN